jgi:hypothetical protein
MAELLEGRHREAWRATAALGLGIGLWLALPVWVAGQGLDAGQAWWLLGPPPGRGAVSASLADAPLSWLLVAAGLAAAILPWRHRSGARSDPPSPAARLLAWTATTAGWGSPWPGCSSPRVPTGEPGTARPPTTAWPGWWPR